ncbi:MAG: response regulator transcription factor [Chloroflexota bacterium]
MVSSVVLASNSDLLNKGMTIILEEDLDCAVVAMAKSTQLLLSRLEKYQPDVAIIEDSLYGAHILDLLAECLKTSPSTKILILGFLTDGLFVRDLFHAGADGYLCLYDDLCDCLTLAVDTVLSNGKYLSYAANAEYLVAMQSPQRHWHLDHEARHILQMLARGHRACEIAESLDIETRRVYHVRQKLRKRFNAETNEHLISVAIAEGFIYP